MNFTRRPDRSAELANEDVGNKRGYGAKDQQSSKQQLMKKLAKFKKNKRPTASKGAMHTVKIDF